MLRVITYIARYTVITFLLCAISGLTLTVHHEHHLDVENRSVAHDADQHDGHAIKTSGMTYHEIHFVKLLSGDDFDGTQKLQIKTSPTGLFAAYSNLCSSPSYCCSSSIQKRDLKDTGPPSVDKCVLFCSFLI